MERDQRTTRRGEFEPGRDDRTPSAETLIILRRYSAGELSARQAAKAMGPDASEHDVFAGIISAGLRLPEPSSEDLKREVAALRALYGPTGRASNRPKNKGVSP